MQATITPKQAVKGMAEGWTPVVAVVTTHLMEVQMYYSVYGGLKAYEVQTGEKVFESDNVVTIFTENGYNVLDPMQSGGMFIPESEWE